MHRRIAAMIRHDPDLVIGKAMRNIHAWKERGGNAAVCGEWLELLTRMSPDETADFIISENEHAARLRQSSPFAGVLTPREVWTIKRGHEAA